MADSLAIVTGIFAIVFLLFYLAFNLSREHDLLKLILVCSGLFFIALIPGQLQQESTDCGILSDGTYRCYYTNGTQVTDFGQGNQLIGQAFISYTYILWLIFGYGLYFVGRKVFVALGIAEKWSESLKRKVRK